jgi:hypothetical protein
LQRVRRTRWSAQPYGALAGELILVHVAADVRR